MVMAPPAPHPAPMPTRTGRQGETAGREGGSGGDGRQVDTEPGRGGEGREAWSGTGAIWGWAAGPQATTGGVRLDPKQRWGGSRAGSQAVAGGEEGHS